MPKVTVILTSYNHAKYLRDSIESVLNQTYAEFDLIIWDDGSTDESWQIITSYSDPRIRAFRNETIARGTPIKNAISVVETGEYIAIQHSDDVWEPQKLEKQTAFLNVNPQVGAVFTWAQMIDEVGQPFQDESHSFFKIFEQPNRTRFEWLNHFFYDGNALCHPSVLIRKECYAACGLYRYGLGQLGDFDMWVRLCLKYEIHVLSERLVRFRIRSDKANASALNPEVHIRTQFEFLQIYSNYLSINDRDEFIKVFPSASNYLERKNFDIHFALAMTALSSPHNFGKYFGLQLLFNLLNDSEKFKNLEEIYGFGNIEMNKLTAQYDIFSVITLSELFAKIQSLTGKIESLTGEIQSLTGKELALNQILQSRSWKLLQLFQRIRLKILPIGSLQERLLQMMWHAFNVLRNDGISVFMRRSLWKVSNIYAGQPKLEYANWIKENESWNETEAIHRIESFTYRPLVSVIVPVYNTDPIWLDKCIESVKSQIYENWELCLYDDASTNPLTIECLRKWENADERIRVRFGVENLHIAEASNEAIEMSTGEFVALLDHDDEISVYALYFVVSTLNKHPHLDLIYSDEDKIDKNNTRYAPYFKPDWNPELFVSQNYINHFSIYRTELIKKLGGFRKGTEGAQDWDLVLRAAESVPASHIFHIPFVLYHWRAISGSTALSGEQKKYIYEAQRKCLLDHFNRVGRKV